MVGTKEAAVFDLRWVPPPMAYDLLIVCIFGPPVPTFVDKLVCCLLG